MLEWLYKNDIDFRNYNSALSFCSMGANIQIPPGIGPYCFKIQGHIYHFASPLHSENGKEQYVNYNFC